VTRCHTLPRYNPASFNLCGAEMKKIVLVYGFIAGAMLSAFMLLTLPFLEKIGSANGYIVGYTGMVLGFLMIYFGVRSYRDNVGGGKVSFGRAFAVGLLITLLSSACYVATWELVYYKLMPDFSEKFAAQSIQKAKESGATGAELAAQTKKIEEFKEMYKNPLINIALTLIEPLPVGLLFTLVSAGVLSRKRKTEGVAVA
jgi:hypothetical protein